jgi:uncharacterized protein (TIGR00296 family)
MSNNQEQFSLEDGKRLIQFARRNIENYLKTGRKLPIPEDIKQKFDNECGAFVTLNKYNVSGNPLRGCIGYIEPRFKLCEVVHKVSISAACEDPRFPSVSIDELNNIVLELSILTPPELLEFDDPEDYINEIEIGRDGLIVERGMRRGLLLPQVPVDQERNWDAKKFLEQTCQKAWLPKDAWKDPETKVYKFEAILFEEEEPEGEIKRKYLK